jgi:RND family efflux transporter MFP subunit
MDVDHHPKRSVELESAMQDGMSGWMRGLRGFGQIGAPRRLAAALVVAALALSGCRHEDKDARLDPPLVLAAAARPAAQGERSFTGLVSARVQSDLGFRVPGKIVERLVDTGAVVRRGQILMRIGRTDFALAVTADVQAVAAAKARVIDADADERRYRGLIGTGAVSEQTYQHAKAAADSAHAELAAAEARAAVTRNQGDYSLLIADADGTVVETLAEPGQVVAAGQTVLKLAHQGPREATVNLPEDLRPPLGSAARALLYDGDGASSPAHLRQLSDAADPQTRTFEARYVLDGDAARAPLGATVTIRIADDQAAALTEVPLGALYDGGLGTGVWVIEARTSTVSFRHVEVARVGNETALLRDGLHNGDQVVALGAQLLHEGETVRFTPVQEAEN